MIVKVDRYAAARIAGLTPARQAQVQRLLKAIVLADTTVGRPWVRDNRGRLQWIVSASDTHVVYRIAFRRVENTLYVTNVLVFDTPPDPNNPE